MIEAHGLTKRYGDKTAVEDLGFTVRPGIVTGFLGPNGAGKSTTMRMILGLDAPTSGGVTVNGRAYADHPAPLLEVGALLAPRTIHTGRPPPTTCWRWRRPPASAGAGSRRSSTWSACARSPTSAPHRLPVVAPHERDGPDRRPPDRRRPRPAHSIYLQGIDTEEIIATVHARRAPMISASAGLQL